MKQIAVFLVLFLGNITSTNAQCIANAGPDQVGCNANGFDSLQLGGNPTAIGNGPFTYAWESHFSIGSFNLYASDFLDDTTSANPKLISDVYDQVFYVTVTDSIGGYCTDSVLINYSSFMYHLGGCKTYFINQGDSVFCSGWMNPIGSLPPFTYLWQPSHGLRDSTSEAFWAKPDSSISYRVTVTDSAGCSATGPDVYCIVVNKMGVDENISSKNAVRVFPNPAKNQVEILISFVTNETKTIVISDGAGKEILSTQFQDEKLTVNSSQFRTGIYFFNITTNHKLLGAGKFVVY